MRKIIHIDMDAFYASIEQRDYPEYKGKPVVVGGSPEGRGGVVAAASYEARKFGIHSAMSSRTALQLCPNIIFLRPRFEAYQEVSRQIRGIFRRYTDLIEPLSLDEAYLDVTIDKEHIGSAIEIAGRIREAIRKELNLTASAGVSINKFVAKIASDMNKPDGLTFIGPSRIEKFMEDLSIDKFFGVGKVTAQKMKKLGLHHGADLKKLTENELIKNFGKAGRFFYKIVRGQDDREVQPHRETKSVGAEDTFPWDLTTLDEMFPHLGNITAIVVGRLQKYKLKGRTISVKIKYHDFRLATRSLSLEEATDDFEVILTIAKQLLQATNPEDHQIRLLGVSLSNFRELRSLPPALPTDQLTLF